MAASAVTRAAATCFLYVGMNLASLSEHAYLILALTYADALNLAKHMPDLGEDLLLGYLGHLTYIESRQQRDQVSVQGPIIAKDDESREIVIQSLHERRDSLREMSTCVVRVLKGQPVDASLTFE